MRVCLVAHQFPPRFQSGTELYALRVARELAARGHRVRVYAGEPCFDELPRLSELDTTISEIPVRRVTATPLVGPERVRGEYDSAWLAERFGRFLEAEQPDVVHVFHLKFLGAGLLEEAWLRGVPTVVHLCDFWSLCPRATLLRTDGALCDGPSDVAQCIDCMAGEPAFGYDELARRIQSQPARARAPEDDDGRERAREVADARERAREAADRRVPERSLEPAFEAARERAPFLRRALELADALIAPSHSLRSMFLRNGYPERIEVLGYAVSDDLASARTPSPNSGVRFGFLGSLLPHKGVDVLLRAFAELDWPAATLALHGDPDADRAFGAELRRAVALDRRMCLAGEFDPERLRAVLSSFDVLVVPSIWRENTPFVALEARATETPIVGSRVDGLVEAAGVGRGALHFARGDAHELAARLRAFRDDPELLERLRREIRPVKRMSEHAGELLDVYRRVASEHPAPGDERSRLSNGEHAATEPRHSRRVEILERRNRALVEQLSHDESTLKRVIEEIERCGAEIEKRGTEIELCREEMEHRGADIERFLAEIEHRAAEIARCRAEIEHRGIEIDRLTARNARLERGLGQRLVRALGRLVGDRGERPKATPDVSR